MQRRAGSIQADGALVLEQAYDDQLRSVDILAVFLDNWLESNPFGNPCRNAFSDCAQ